MGMKSVRMSRVNHPMPRAFYNTDTVCDESIRDKGYRSGSVLRDRDAGQFVRKAEPDYYFPKTKTPKSNERPSNGGVSGKIRSRQADKSSRSKQ